MGNTGLENEEEAPERASHQELYGADDEIRFSDIEHAVADEAGLIGPHTGIATTVHEAQVLDRRCNPMTSHAVRLDMSLPTG